MTLINLNVKNLILAASFLIITLSFLSSCSKSSPKPTPSNSNNLTITSLSISQGSYYAAVIIKGTGFDEILANNQVFFNGKRAAIDMASPTEIFAHVPLAAGTGNVTIKVNGATATGPIFTYVPALVVSTFAGLYQGNVNGTGDSARFMQLSSIAIDKNDNLYVTDQGTYEIKKITPQAQVTTFAGPGKVGNTDGTVLTATFGYMTGIAVDQQENIYVVDGGTLRKITPNGNVSTLSLYITPFTGGNQVDPQGVCTDISGTVYITDGTHHLVGKVASNGQVTVVSGSHYFVSPWGIAADNGGNLFLADGGVFKITQNNLLQLAPSGPNGFQIQQAEGIAVDAEGNIYIADTINKYIEKVTPNGAISIVAGTFTDATISTDGVVNLASFTFPSGVVVDSKGNIFVADVTSVREIAFQ